MEDIKWFELYKESSALQNVLFFLNRLPSNMNLLYVEPHSNFISYYIAKDGDYGISEGLFFSAFEQCVSRLRKNVKDFEAGNYLYRYGRWGEYILEKEEVEIILKDIGFTGSELELKSKTLNKLWTKVVVFANNVTKGIIDFANNDLVKLLRKFLAYLNSLLGSLKELIPGIEGIKEFKEVSESYLAIADNS